MPVSLKGAYFPLIQRNEQVTQRDINILPRIQLFRSDRDIPDWFHQDSVSNRLRFKSKIIILKPLYPLKTAASNRLSIIQHDRRQMNYKYIKQILKQGQ
jgi:hypothetical protein